jgi:hypothetical protein
MQLLSQDLSYAEERKARHIGYVADRLITGGRWVRHELTSRMRVLLKD